MLLSFVIYFIIARCVCVSKHTTHSLRLFKLWSVIYIIYALYAIITDCYVENPFTTFFISRDQMFFYKSAINVCDLSVIEIFRTCFSTFEYSELPLAIAWFGCLAKFANIIGVDNILLFEKLNVCFFASLIPIYIYKTILFRVKDSNRISRQIFYFAVFSPLLCLSAQLLRDIHVCFMYTLMAYVALKPVCRFRYVYLILLCYIAFSLRVENGLFAIIFFTIPLYQYYERSSTSTRAILMILCVVGLVFSISAILKIKSIMDDTLDLYTTQSIAKASSDSLGVKLNYLPFPLNTISKTIFAQFLPFPLWLPFLSNDSYNYLRIVECLTPFYWIPILWSIMLNINFIVKDRDRLVLLMIIISLLYLLLCSSGEFGTRRLLAIYPLIFISYIMLQNRSYISTFRTREYTIFLLLFLHIIYILIK